MVTPKVRDSLCIGSALALALLCGALCCLCQPGQCTRVPKQSESLSSVAGPSVRVRLQYCGRHRRRSTCAHILGTTSRASWARKRDTRRTVRCLRSSPGARPPACFKSVQRAEQRGTCCCYSCGQACYFKIVHSQRKRADPLHVLRHLGLSSL